MKETSSSRIDRHAMGMIGVLILQYILGIAVNLYVQFPEGASAAQNWDFMRGQWLVWAHLILGTLIVLGTISLYVRAIKLKDKTWKIAGGIAMGSVILAWISGEEFVSGQVDIYSFIMSLLFIIALVSLGWGVYQSKKKS
jgi:hypothetical protein